MKTIYYIIFGSMVLAEISMVMRFITGLEEMNLPYIAAMGIMGFIGYFAINKATAKKPVLLQSQLANQQIKKVIEAPIQTEHEEKTTFYTPTKEPFKETPKVVDEDQKIREQFIVGKFRQLGKSRNCAPTEKCSDKKIVEIYQNVARAFRTVAKTRGEHIPAKNMNAIVFKFIQVYEVVEGEFFMEHLNYEVEKYQQEGLRPDYLDQEISFAPETDVDDTAPLETLSRLPMPPIVDKIVESITDGKSPLENWLDLDYKKTAELYIFHLVYGWMFLKDHELFKSDDKLSLVIYITRSFIQIKKLEPQIVEERFMQIFNNRFVKLTEELLMLRKTQLSDTTYFPTYFYQRVCNFPMLMNDFSHVEFKDEFWENWQLADMFTHQINHLEDQLQKHL